MMMTQNGFISPTTIQWTHSAELLVVVALGGMGYRWGAVVGAGLWGVLVEFLPQLTEYWHWPMGVLVIAIILFAPHGLCALFSRSKADAVRRQQRHVPVVLIDRQGTPR